MTTSTWDILDRAHRTPEGRGRRARRPVGTADPCSEWDVTQVLQHAAGDQLGYAAVLGHGQGPDFDPFAPSGSLSTTVTDLLEPALEAAAEAFAGVAADDGAVPVPLPQGPSPLRWPSAHVPWMRPCTPGTSPWRRGSLRPSATTSRAS